MGPTWERWKAASEAQAAADKAVSEARPPFRSEKVDGVSLSWGPVQAVLGRLAVPDGLPVALVATNERDITLVTDRLVARMAEIRKGLRDWCAGEGPWPEERK